jgi:hypothetical protein
MMTPFAFDIESACASVGPASPAQLLRFLLLYESLGAGRVLSKEPLGDRHLGVARVRPWCRPRECRAHRRCSTDQPGSFAVTLPATATLTPGGERDTTRDSLHTHAMRWVAVAPFL